MTKLTMTRSAFEITSQSRRPSATRSVPLRASSSQSIDCPLDVWPIDSCEEETYKCNLSTHIGHFTHNFRRRLSQIDDLPIQGVETFDVCSTVSAGQFTIYVPRVFPHGPSCRSSNMHLAFFAGFLILDLASVSVVVILANKSL